MMKYFILSVALSLAAAVSDECKQSIFDQCHYGTPFTSIHADTFEICEETCNVYAGIDSCDYFTYTIEGAIDENCDIYTSSQTQSEFQAGCNIIGAQVNDADRCIVYEDSCTAVPPCTECIACGSGSCAGYMESKCSFIGEVLESLEADLNRCQKLCQLQPKGAFVVMNIEENTCECYSDTAVKDCKMAIVQQGTVVDDCRVTP